MATELRDQISAARLLFPAGVFVSDGAPSHHINIHTGAPVRATLSRDGKVLRTVQAPGDMEIIPAGQQGRWEDQAPAELLSLRIAPGYVDAVAARLGLQGHAAALRPAVGFRDSQLAHILMALEAALAEPIPPCPLVLDSLGIALISRALGRPGNPQDTSRGPVAPHMIARALDYIHGNLSEPLLLQDLAERSGAGLSQFKVMFKIATGLSPRRYIIRERVRRAKALIETSELGLVNVAMETGFSHQSHLTRAMRRELGITPGALARKVGHRPAE